MDSQHTVTLKDAGLMSNELILTTIDSGATTGETVVKVPLSKNGELEIGGKKDKLCLGNKFCYYLKL